MKLGEVIKAYRTEHDLSLRDFAKRCDLSYSYIGMLENGYDYRTKKPISPTLDALYKVAYGLGTDIDSLISMLDEDSIVDLKVVAPSFETVPILGVVKAGYDYLAEQNIVGYVNCQVKDKENCFALKVKGDSMEPILYEGDIIVVHKQNDVENGQVAVVLINGDEATVKKVNKNKDSIELIAFNSYYPPKKMTEGFTIIGKVIEANITKIFE